MQSILAKSSLSIKNTMKRAASFRIKTSSALRPKRCSSRMKKIARRRKKPCRLQDKDAKQLKLEMKLIKAEYTFDRSRLTFHFSSEGRIDSGNWSANWRRFSVRGSNCIRLVSAMRRRFLEESDLAERQLCCSTFPGGFCAGFDQNGEGSRGCP